MIGQFPRIGMSPPPAAGGTPQSGTNVLGNTISGMQAMDSIGSAAGSIRNAGGIGQAIQNLPGKIADKMTGASANIMDAASHLPGVDAASAQGAAAGMRAKVAGTSQDAITAYDQAGMHDVARSLQAGDNAVGGNAAAQATTQEVTGQAATAAASDAAATAAADTAATLGTEAATTGIAAGMEAGGAAAGAAGASGALAGLSAAMPWIGAGLLAVSLFSDDGLFADGGGVEGREDFTPGGSVSGAGGPTDDAIPAWLSNDEHVQNAISANLIGHDVLDQLNEQGLKVRRGEISTKQARANIAGFMEKRAAQMKGRG